MIEAIGELIDRAEAEKRLRERRLRGEVTFYMIEVGSCRLSDGFGKNLVIDATTVGNESRFINHSCQPSCSLEKWKVHGEERCI